MKHLTRLHPLLMLACVLFGVPASGVEIAPTGEVLATFDGFAEGWRGYEGAVRPVASPSLDGKGSLQAAVALSGHGWSDVTIESPELNRDFSQYRELRVSVFVLVGVSVSLKAQVFVKSGPSWTWSDSGWPPLPHGRWTTIVMPIPRVAYPAQVRTVGLKIGSNDRFNGEVFLDRVELLRAQAPAQPQVAVRILEIVENSRITGRVLGVPAERVHAYKVLVYVKTDKWYIHPYERGGAGLSFARINPDGSWQIETIKRRFLADLVAAVVVPADFAAPAQVDDPRGIGAVAVYIEEGRGRL